MTALNEITARRLRMLANGYAPLPVVGKRPPINGWPTITIDETAIRSWGDSSLWLSTGARTGDTIALDVDIRDDAMADAIEKLVRERYGNGAGRLMRRIGMPPKRAFLFRTDAPFEKIQVSFKAPGDSDDDKPHKIEVLGRGQQVVVDGIHPDTGKPYEWLGGEPWTVPRSELPKLSQAAATSLVGDIARLVLGTPGWRQPGARQNAGDDAQTGTGEPLIVQLATQLWGPGRHVEYTRELWRFGTRGSKSVDTSKGYWFDFEAIEGGGIRELMAKVVAARSAREGGTPADGVAFVEQADFVRGFVAPDYLVDGIIQRGFIYALTAQTGDGKTALALLFARGVGCVGDFKIGAHDVARGRVVYFVGENPDDIRARVIGANALRSDDASLDRISYVPGVFDIAGLYDRVAAEAERVGGVDLVVVDTSAAYFLGDDENNNTQAGGHARTLRSLTALAGRPCVLVLCHPIKNVTDRSQLVPRGGGAFLAEVDGNLIAWRYGDDLVDLHHTSKLRGRGFEPVTFKIEKITTPALVDKNGRMITTVRAVAVTEAEAAEQARIVRSDEDVLLAALAANPNRTVAELAIACRWFYGADVPAKSKVARRLDHLKSGGLIKRSRDTWELTPAGKRAFERGRAFAAKKGKKSPAGTACEKCGRADGEVFEISDTRNPAFGKHPLHEACAEAYFEPLI
jgi:hypothetical protein